MAALLCLDPVITTTHGKVRGQLRKTVYDDEYYCFDGIPYAKPPLGELRFKSPVALEPWEDIRDCSETAPKCIQYNRYTKQIEGSEDCLYLNIYVKSFNSLKHLPVMVFIHGGMFTTGDASSHAWGPDYFMMKDVVLISIGHRLGALGFLSLTDPSLKVPGNAGIKDVVMALKWIKSNCIFFNGDPDNITLFGHSSGSGVVNMLLLNSRCVGLFHKAILMAGFFFNFDKVPNVEYRLAKYLGYKGTDNDKDVYEFLIKVPSEKLVNLDFLTPEERDRGVFLHFVPTIEPFASDDSILLKEPIELLQQAWSNSIPIMMGNTSMEALLQYKHLTSNEDLYKTYKLHPEYLLPEVLQKNCSIEVQKKLAQKIIKLHFGDKEIAIENVFSLIDLLSYSSQYHNSHRLMLARRAKNTKARTYLYRFDFDSPTFNLYRIKHCGPDMRGVAHVDELSYIFYMPTSFKLDIDSAEFQTIIRMIDMWTSFAACSNPNAISISMTDWEPLDREDPNKTHNCLNISNDVSFIEWPEMVKCKIWDNVFKEGGIKLF